MAQQATDPTTIVWDRDFYRQTLVDLDDLMSRRAGDPALKDMLRERIFYALENPPSEAGVAMTTGGCPAPSVE